MQKLNQTERAVDLLIENVGTDIVMATPLGVGKPNHFLNALYQKVKNNPNLNLTLLTALSLNPPTGKNFLERAFLEPLNSRVFPHYPVLQYEEDRRRNRLPQNVQVIEFYFQAGQYKNMALPQQNYLSSNYTHVVRDVFHRGVNAICQQVASLEVEGDWIYSLSCNSDLTIDLDHLCQLNKRDLYKVAQTNDELPFMYGESVVDSHFFDIIVENPSENFPLFAPPKMPVTTADFMIGTHASTLVKDDGELQIGIGSLADALVYALCLRQNQNQNYRKILKDLGVDEKAFPVLKKYGDQRPFEKGLFAGTEMLVDAISELYKSGILKKKVFDHVIIQRLLNDGLITEEIGGDILELLVEHKAIHQILNEQDVTFLKDFGIFKETVFLKNGLIVCETDQFKPDLNDPDNLEKIKSKALGEKLRNGAVAHGGFFLGPKAFYQFLQNLPIAERKLFRMKRISQINQLYGHEEIDRLQRTRARFINTCMKVSLDGAACSDVLENGQQISGVGGQYNFVAMAHELPEARSILQLRSTRKNSSNQWESNIVFRYGRCTIPKHLRDIVITEYGIADLRGKTDSEVAIELIQIADSRFQDQLIVDAQKALKIPKNFQLQERFQSNNPSKVERLLGKYKREGCFPTFPFGTDLTPEEIKLGKALKKLKSISRGKMSLFLFLIPSLLGKKARDDERSLLGRLQLSRINTLKHWVYQRLVLRAIRKTHRAH